MDDLEGSRGIAFLNGKSGTLRGLDMEEMGRRIHDRFARRGCAMEIVRLDRLDEDARLVVERERPDLVLCAGGDGSTSALAEAAHHTGAILAVLPGGTMNLYAQTLGVPLDVEEAIDAIAEAPIAKADLAFANDRPFVNQYTLGFQPVASRLRERMQYASRWGKMWATTRALTQVAFAPPRFRLRLTLDGKDRGELYLSNLSVSNNCLGEGHMPFADRCDEGVLGIYTTDPVSTTATAKLLMDVAVGRWAQNPAVTSLTARRATVELTKAPRSRRATSDGELVALENRIEFRIEPAALSVLLPAGNRRVAAGAEEKNAA